MKVRVKLGDGLHVAIETLDHEFPVAGGKQSTASMAGDVTIRDVSGAASISFDDLVKHVAIRADMHRRAFEHGDSPL